MKQVVVIAGPTGSGESSITKGLIDRYQNCKRLVTATTRPPRSGEQEGVDYYYFSKDDFMSEVEKGEILEYTHVPNRDVYYGTYKPDLDIRMKRGEIIILNPDIVGAKYFKKHYNAITIFVEAESVEVLGERLKKRNPEISEVELSMRLESAEIEIKNEKSFYDYSVINRDGRLEDVIDEISDILVTHGYELVNKKESVE